MPIGTASTMTDDDAIFADPRADAIFLGIFDKTPDGSFDLDRDWELSRAALNDLVALGYTKSQANTFLNENFDCCETEA